MLLVPFVVVRSSNHKVQCPNLKFKGTTNYANCTNHLAISIRVIRTIRSCSMFVVLIIKFNVKPQIQRDYELRELHESLSKSIRVIRAIRSRSIFVVLIIKFKVQTSMFKGQEVLIIKFKVQTSMFKGQCLYLWWSLTLMFGEEATAVSIEEFFECFNL